MVTFQITGHERAHVDGRPLVLANVEYTVGGEVVPIQFRFYAEDRREGYARMQAKRLELELKQRADELSARVEQLAAADPISAAQNDLVEFLAGHAGKTVFAAPEKPAPTPAKLAEEEAAAAAK